MSSGLIDTCVAPLSLSTCIHYVATDRRIPSSIDHSGVTAPVALIHILCPVTGDHNGDQQECPEDDPLRPRRLSDVDIQGTENRVIGQGFDPWILFPDGLDDQYDAANTHCNIEFLAGRQA